MNKQQTDDAAALVLIVLSHFKPEKDCEWRDCVEKAQIAVELLRQEAQARMISPIHIEKGIVHSIGKACYDKGHEDGRADALCHARAGRLDEITPIITKILGA